MTIQGKEELFDENGNIAVWGRVSASGKPFYTFNLTEDDKYILFPQTYENPKGPKFILKKVDSNRGPNKEHEQPKAEVKKFSETEEVPF